MGVGQQWPMGPLDFLMKLHPEWLGGEEEINSATGPPPLGLAILVESPGVWYTWASTGPRSHLQRKRGFREEAAGLAAPSSLLVTL